MYLLHSEFDYEGVFKHYWEALVMFEKSRKLFVDNLHMIGDDRDDLDSMFPLIIEKGKGAKVWDLDGNEYIDFTNACGSIVLGYCYDEVDDYVIHYLKNYGNVFPTQYHEKKVELTKKLLKIFPNHERAVYFKTGSDATEAALRIARVATGKDLILTCGYHGWHDWQLNNFPRFQLADDSRHINFRYNLELLKEQIKINKDNVAAVIITPDINFFDKNYFKEVETIVKGNDILFILDEVASGFKYCLGGLQKLLDLNPDMTCLGKGLANGYSISAVLGNNSVMKNACLETHMWSTYNGEMTGFTAALKTIEIIERENVREKVEILGGHFINSLEALFEKYSVSAEVLRNPNLFHIMFEDSNFHKRFTLECIMNGVLLSKDFENMLNYCHIKDVVDEALYRIEKALQSLMKKGLINSNKPRKRLSRKAINTIVQEEFDADIDYTIYNDRI